MNYKGSIIINTNLTFYRWEEIFKDITLTWAIDDMLAHLADILFDIARDISYRYDDNLAWLNGSK